MALVILLASQKNKNYSKLETDFIFDSYYTKN